MKPRDEMTALAADYLTNRDTIAKHVAGAFTNIPRAPLASLIDDFLKTSPNINIAPILKRIADINQGRIEDLDSPEFRSYLIATCETSDIELRSIIGTLVNFQSFNTAKIDADRQVLIAARDESNSGQKSATLNELLKQREKRIR